MTTHNYSNAELLDALRYALKIIDDTADVAKRQLALIPAAEIDSATGMPCGAASAARMILTANLRGLAIYGPSNAGALRAIANGDAPKPWRDPVQDIRARLS